MRGGLGLQKTRGKTTKWGGLEKNQGGATKIVGTVNNISTFGTAYK